jgi:hypothetical protein
MGIAAPLAVPNLGFREISMSGEDIKLLAAMSNYILIPAVGFVAGFFARWFLQTRKSRDELLRELSPQRANALRSLWVTTTLPAEIVRLEDYVVLPLEFRQSTDLAIGKWYTREAGALFLSWQATQLLFRLLDVLRDNTSNKKQVADAVSLLRTRLKRDCGLYTAWEGMRQLVGPRRSPWPANPAVERDMPQAAGGSA